MCEEERFRELAAATTSQECMNIYWAAATEDPVEAPAVAKAFELAATVEEFMDVWDGCWCMLNDELQSQALQKALEKAVNEEDFELIDKYPLTEEEDGKVAARRAELGLAEQ